MVGIIILAVVAIIVMIVSIFIGMIVDLFDDKGFRRLAGVALIVAVFARIFQKK